jgi:hypothetical protein
MSLLDFGLGLAGMPEPTIRELNKQLPALERLATVAKEAEPLLVQLGPYVKRAAPDIIAVTPLIQQLIAFAKAKNAGQ